MVQDLWNSLRRLLCGTGHITTSFEHFFEDIFSQSTPAHSALGTLAITDMYYTNPRFTYLLTNVVVWLGILHVSEVALQ